MPVKCLRVYTLQLRPITGLCEPQGLGTSTQLLIPQSISRSISTSSPESRAVWECSGTAAWGRWCSYCWAHSGSPGAGPVWARLCTLSWEHSRTAVWGRLCTAVWTPVWAPRDTPPWARCCTALLVLVCTVVWAPVCTAVLAPACKLGRRAGRSLLQQSWETRNQRKLRELLLHSLAGRPRKPSRKLSHTPPLAQCRKLARRQCCRPSRRRCCTRSR